MDRPRISVVVPVWNGAGLIGKCLDALAGQTVERSTFEVIVVDNGSTDATVAVVSAYPDVRLLVEPRASSYIARNTGIAAARYPVVLFTDADCIPAPDWIEHAFEALRTMPGKGIYGGRIKMFQCAGSSAAAYHYDTLFELDQERRVEVGRAVTANWMSYRDVLLRYGGFDAALKSCGDSELSTRIHDAGEGVVYVPAMVVAHPARENLRMLVSKRRRIVGGRWTEERSTAAAVLTWVKGYSLEAAGNIRRVNRSHLEASAKLSVVRLIVVLWFWSIVELFRMAAGRTPQRA